MKVRELMVKDIVTLDKDVSVHHATRIMNWNRIGCLVALDNDEIVGIVTERDLLERVLEACKDPKTTKVSEIMTQNVIVGRPDMELTEVSTLMFDRKIKKLPIVENNRLVGLITLTDIARAIQVDEKTTRLIDALSNMHMPRESTWPTIG